VGVIKESKSLTGGFGYFEYGYSNAVTLVAIRKS
jgi:hypothetical protein